MMTEKVGLSPGMAIYTGKVKVETPSVSLIHYNKEHFNITTYKDANYIESIASQNETQDQQWVHVEPISDQHSISKIGLFYKLHSLVIEDLLSVAHRPKAEEYRNYIFVIIKYPQYLNSDLTFSQISFVLTKGSLLSFADASPKRFENIIKRLEKKDSKIRNESVEYLLFNLIDYIVDSYFVVLEKIGDEIEELEDEILNSPSKKSIEHVHRLKRTLINFKKTVWPMREVINLLMNSDEMNPKYHLYYRDVYDHIINIIDIIEGNKESVSSFLDIYLSTLSNRMNEIMKTLSIISTIFIPLSFLTGYFGMNFKYQAVLESQSAYNWSIALMVIVPIILLAYFKIRKWF